jgi:hypothetical protein
VNSNNPSAERSSGLFSTPHVLQSAQNRLTAGSLHGSRFV